MTKELNFLFSSNNKKIKNANYAKNKIISNLKKVEKVLDKEKFKNFQRDLIVNLNGGTTVNVSIKDNKYKFLVGGVEDEDDDQFKGTEEVKRIGNNNEEGNEVNESNDEEFTGQRIGNDNEEGDEVNGNNDEEFTGQRIGNNNEEGDEVNENNDEEDDNNEEEKRKKEEEGGNDNNEEGGNEKETVPINNKLKTINNKISSIQTTLESISGKILNSTTTETSTLLNNTLGTEGEVVKFITDLNPISSSSTSAQNTAVVDGDGSEEDDEVNESNSKEFTGKRIGENNEKGDEVNENNNEEFTGKRIGENNEKGDEVNENNNEEFTGKRIGKNNEEDDEINESNSKEFTAKRIGENNEEDNEDNKENLEQSQFGKGLNNQEPPKKGFFSKIFSLIGGSKDYDSDGSEMVTSFFSDDDSENDQFSLSSFEKMYDDQTYLFDEADSDEESLIDNAKQLKNKKYLNSLNVSELRSIMKDNNLQLSKKGSYLKKNEMIKVIKKNII